MRAIQDSPTHAPSTAASRLTVVTGHDARSEPMVTIATYDDYRRALAAVTELCAEGRRPRGLHLASTEFETVQVRPDSNLRHEVTQALAPALLGAAGLSAAAALVGGVSLSGTFWVLMATTLAVSAVAAGVVALWRARGEGLLVAKERLVPVAYELRCHRADAPEAEHHLAGWWKTGVEGPPLSAGGRRIVAR